MKARKTTFYMMLAIMGWAGIAGAGSIDFTILPVSGSPSPSIAYAGGAAPLIGTDLSTVSVLSEGTPANDGGSLAVQAEMSFSTGNLTSTTADSWIFAGGGSFAIIGTVSGVVGTPATLFSGQFVGDTTVLDLGSNNYKVIGAAITGELNPTLAAYFGLPYPDTYMSGVSLLFRGPESPPGSFNDTTLSSGNVGITSLPEPASWTLLCLGAVGCAFYRRRPNR